MGAGGLLGSLYWKITHDSTEFNKGVNDARKSANNLKNDFENIGKSMTSVGDKMTMGVTVPLLALGTAFLKTASDSEEMNSKFNTVFKDQAASVRKWNEEYSDSVGRSANENIKFLASLQDLFVPFGFARTAAADFSKSTLKLATDLASFNNLKTEDTLRDITSALVGNTETVRKYGVVITENTLNQKLLAMGIKGGTAAATEQEKVTARLTMIMEGNSDAMGDAVRTAGSFANQLKSVEAKGIDVANSFGKLIIPSALELLNVGKGVLTWINSLDDDTKKMLVTMGGIAIISGPVISAVGRIMSALSTMNPVLLAIGAGVAVISGLVLVVNQLAHGSDTLADKARAENKVIKDQIDRYKELKEKTNLSNSELEEMEKIKARLIELDPDLKKGIDENTGALNLNEEALRKVNLQMLEKEKLALETQKKTQQADVDKRLDAIKKESLWTLMTAEEQKERLDTDIALGNARQKILFTDKALLEVNEKIKEIKSTMPIEKPSITGNKVSGSEFKPLDIAGFKEEFDTTMELISDNTDETTEDIKAKWKAVFDEVFSSDKVFSYIDSIGSSFKSMIAGISAAQMQELDNQMKAELEAAGVADDTAVESAEKKLAEAKKGGKAEEIAAAQTALKKAQIEETYEKKKRKLAYDTAMLQWELNLALTIASAAQVMLNAWNSAPFPLNVPAMIIGGILSAFQIGAVMAAKPVMPQAKEGAFLSGDAQIQAHANEVIFPLDTGIDKMVDKLVSKMMTMTVRQGLASPDQMIHNQIILDGQVLFDAISRASDNNLITINSKSVT